MAPFLFITSGKISVILSRAVPFYFISEQQYGLSLAHFDCGLVRRTR